MPPRYVIADGLGIAYWIQGEYWTADITAARQFRCREYADFWATAAGVAGYTIQPVPAEKIEASWR